MMGDSEWGDSDDDLADDDSYAGLSYLRKEDLPTSPRSVSQQSQDYFGMGHESSDGYGYGSSEGSHCATWLPSDAVRRRAFVLTPAAPPVGAVTTRRRGMATDEREEGAGEDGSLGGAAAAGPRLAVKAFLRKSSGAGYLRPHSLERLDAQAHDNFGSIHNEIYRSHLQHPPPGPPGTRASAENCI